MNRKTATILCAAGGLVAAAVALESRSDQAQAAARPEPGKVHTPKLPPVTNQDTCALDKALPARATTDFGPGSLIAGLSSTRLLAGGSGEVFMAIDLSIEDKAADKRAPVNMAIVIDRSGSMSGDKIAQARQAARGIVQRLGAEDRVALIQYDDSAQVLVASIPMDKEGQQKMLAAIDNIHDAGGTNLHGGMMLGIEEAKRQVGGGRINRVVLLSDGQANVGVVDPVRIGEAASMAAEQGVRVTTIGLGVDYNEDLMEAIAEHGRGRYYFVKDGASLEAVFAGELKAMQGTVAQNAELRIDPACAGVEIVEVYGYQYRRDGKSVIVPMTDLFGGEQRKVLVKLRAPAGQAGQKALVAASLGYDDTAGGGHKNASLALGVEVSSDAEAVRLSVDGEVMAKVEQIEAAKTMREAAKAYDRGDVGAAQGMLRTQRSRSKQRAEEFNMPAPAAAALDNGLQEMDEDFGRHAPGSAEGKGSTKKAKADAYDMSK